MIGPRQQTHVRSEVDEERRLGECGYILGVDVSLSRQPASREMQEASGHRRHEWKPVYT